MVEAARARYSQAKLVMEISEANLKAILEKVEELEASKKKMEEDLSICIVAVEAHKLELSTTQALSKKKLKTQDWEELTRRRTE